MAEKVTSLAAEQINRIPEFIDRWTKIGLSSDPANRDEAERGVRIAYQLAGIPAPEKIVWCGSPLSVCLTRQISSWFLTKGNRFPEEYGPCVFDAVVDRARVRAVTSIQVSVCAALIDRIQTILYDKVAQSVYNHIWNPIHCIFRSYQEHGTSGDQIMWKQIKNSVKKSFFESIGPIVLDEAWDNVWQCAWEDNRKNLDRSVADCGYGQHDAGWLGFFEYFKEVCGLVHETQSLEGLWLIGMNAGWFLPHEKICYIGERHSDLNRDGFGRFHNDKGPAIGYPDGSSFWAYHGVYVDRKVIEAPETLSLNDIERVQNFTNSRSPL